MYTEKEIKEAGLDDFRNFLREVWKHLGLPVPTPLQLSIAKTLQHGPDRLIIQAFRGVGKSWITAAFALWTLFMDPHKKILVVSASQPLADAFSIFCKSLVSEMEILEFLKPRSEQRTSNYAWDVGPATPDPAPSMKSAGITGQITGSRADLIIPDDIEIPKNSITHLMRERLAELVKEFDAILKPGGRVCYLGTPQIEQSLYVRLRERGYTTRIWPAEVPPDHDIYQGLLSPYIVGQLSKGLAVETPLEPLRFDRRDLDARRLSYGKAAYALQYLLDTSPADAAAHPLKLRDLIVHDCDNEMGHVNLVWGQGNELVIQDLAAGGFDKDVYHRAAWRSEEMAEYSGTILAVDPSGKGSDETAYAILRILHGQMYLVDVGGFTDGFAESTLETIAARAAKFGVNYVVCEENYGGGMFTQMLIPYLNKHGGGSIDEEYNAWSRGMKELRICDTLQPVMENHRLTVDRKVIEADLEVQSNSPAYSLVYQMTRMKRAKGALAHEDRLEAVAMAVAYWTERLARDRGQALEDHREAELDSRLQRHMEHQWNPFSKTKEESERWF